MPTPTPAPDFDGDGFSDGIDNCPFVFNDPQTNSDPLPAGDACQCGDLDNDGDVDGADLLLARQHVVGATIVGTCVLTRCNVIGPADGGVSSDCNVAASSDCTVADVYVLDRVVAALPVTLENSCKAYTAGP